MGICQQCAKEEKEGVGPWWIWPVLIPLAIAILVIVEASELIPKRKK